MGFEGELVNRLAAAGGSVGGRWGRKARCRGVARAKACEFLGAGVSQLKLGIRHLEGFSDWETVLVGNSGRGRWE